MRFVPDLVQLLGLVLALVGVFLLLGLPWALVAGGVVTTAWGAALEWAGARRGGA